MLDIYRKLYDLLDARERRLTLLVFGFLVLVAFLETVGVASIMPFMAVLANPEVVQTNRYLAAVYDYFGFQSTDRFLFFLGIVFLVVIVSSLAFRAAGFWLQLRFSRMRNHSWGCRLVRAYLHQPYEWFLNQHSGNLASSVLTEVERTVHGALFPALQIVSHALVTGFLLILLIAVDPVLAFSVAAVLGGAYALLFVTVRRRLARIGEESRQANRERYKVTQEMFGGIKDVKVKGLEEVFLERFRRPSRRLALRDVSAKMHAELPSFAMQALVYGGIMAVLLYFLGTRGGLREALPVFSLYAFAGYRLMPALQAIYRALSELRYNIPMLQALHRDLHLQEKGQAPATGAEPGKALPAVELRERFSLANIVYRYPGAERPALMDVNLEIPARTTVGFVGPTGSGKTTLVDLILGLLRPQAGDLQVDGIVLKDLRIRAWQQRIGYVPQHIYLTDDTITANIAFGLPPERVNPAAVERAARIANLHDFVLRELSQGYDTLVGERGVRLSGGQRQRIGIARAMYHDPDLLILDEATSALDNLTEQAVMEAVHNLGSRKTIILIAHRLSTVRECDRIFYLEQGVVVAQGRYDELLASNPQFRRLAAPAAG